jgi:hypothetical protein
VDYYSLSADGDIRTVQRELKHARCLINSIATDAGDLALEAGYDPSVPGEISALATECKGLMSRADLCDKQTEEVKNAIKAYQGVIPDTPRGEDDPSSRRRVATRVATFIVGSPANFSTFLRGLGMPITHW